MTKCLPFKYFKTSPEIIRLAAMLYIRFPLSLRNVEDLLHERGVEISHETGLFWRMRSLQTFASVHASVHNHFNQERGFSSRDTFKANRAAALPGWRGLCVAQGTAILP